MRQVYLVAHVTPGQPAFNQAVAALAARFAASGISAELALKKAQGLLYQALIGQATTLAYLDTFGILAVFAAIMFLLSFALKKNELGGGRVVVE